MGGFVSDCIGSIVCGSIGRIVGGGVDGVDGVDGVVRIVGVDVGVGDIVSIVSCGVGDINCGGGGAIATLPFLHILLFLLCFFSVLAKCGRNANATVFNSNSIE